MNVESATFELIDDPLLPDWVVRVTAKGTGFVERAIPIGARVDDIWVEGLLTDVEATGFVGYLSEIPPDGAHLFVGRLEGDLLDTGITYHAGSA